MYNSMMMLYVYVGMCLYMHTHKHIHTHMYTYQSICMCQILEKKLDEQKQQAANDTPCQEVTKPDPPKGREGKGRSHADSSSSLKQEPVMCHSYRTHHSFTHLAKA